VLDIDWQHAFNLSQTQAVNHLAFQAKDRQMQLTLFLRSSGRTLS
jgi:hypothetical protein